jgi:hypothetical protein
MDIKKDCIYYTDRDKDTQMHLCEYKHTLYLDDENMCKCCRLWDAYIPKNSTVGQIRYAQNWQNMPIDEQPDYDDYFKD